MQEKEEVTLAFGSHEHKWRLPKKRWDIFHIQFTEIKFKNIVEHG